MTRDSEELSTRLRELRSLSLEERRTWLEGRRATDPDLVQQLEGLLAEGSESDATWAATGTGSDASSGQASREIFGPYRLLGELGRGGQGQVHLAEDTRLGRKVALKLLTGFGASSPALLRRFKREAEVASRLDHPGICTVYDTGVVDGVPYIAMRYVEGKSLAHWLAESQDAGRSSVVATFVEFETEAGDTHPESEVVRDAPSTGTQDDVMGVVRFGERVARALHVAHEAGVIHRDVKPGNIMITDGGDPVILDFGLARAVEDGLPALTRTGDVFGTPAYMAPEQLRGSHHEIDARTDVWALGVTLYECLALQRPFAAPTRDGLYRAILEEEPVPLDTLNPRVTRDLAVVVQTALQKERDRRYQSASDLADELARVRRLEPIHARPISTVERTLRWARRNPLVSVLLVVLIVGLSVTILALGEARHQRSVATKAFDERGRALDRTLSRYLAVEPSRLLDRDPELAIGLVVLGLRRCEDEACRSAAWRILRDYDRRPVLDPDGKSLRWLALSPDGATLAAGHEQELRLYDLGSRTLARRCERPTSGRQDRRRHRRS